MYRGRGACFTCPCHRTCPGPAVESNFNGLAQNTRFFFPTTTITFLVVGVASGDVGADAVQGTAERASVSSSAPVSGVRDVRGPRKVQHGSVSSRRHQVDAQAAARRPAGAHFLLNKNNNRLASCSLKRISHQGSILDNCADSQGVETSVEVKSSLALSQRISCGPSTGPCSISGCSIQPKQVQLLR